MAAAALVIGLGGRTLLGGGAQAAKTSDGGYTTAQVTRRDVTAAITVAPTVGAVALAFGISVGIGILFGYLPAKKAAALNPIDALHYD